MVRNLANYLRMIRLRLRGVHVRGVRRLGAAIDARAGSGQHGPGRVEIDLGAWIERGAILHAFGGRITLGRDVFIGPYAVIYGHGGVTVGDATLISMHCRILSSDHTVPVASVDIRSQRDILKPTRIGRDVWLGAGVTVLGGVTIGDGCVVGAGAVVTHDLPPASIALGVPARVTGRRE